MSNNTDAFVSHNIINSHNINGYCFVYKFIDDRIFKWGLSVCDKSNQYEKKLARTLAFQHMQKMQTDFLDLQILEKQHLNLLNILAELITGFGVILH